MEENITEQRGSDRLFSKICYNKYKSRISRAKGAENSDIII